MAFPIMIDLNISFCVKYINMFLIEDELAPNDLRVPIKFMRSRTIMSNAETRVNADTIDIKIIIMTTFMSSNPSHEK